MHNTECGRLLGFPVSWTNPGESHTTAETPYERRNAIGNVFAVPIVARLSFALTLALSVQESSAFPRWGRGLELPYRHDVLDDVLGPISEETKKYSQLTRKFQDYILADEAEAAIGPDP